MMQYKGYFAKVDFDDEDDVFFGEVADLLDVVTFEGRSVDELRKAFHDAVDGYLESCKKLGKEPDKAFSGEFTVQIDASLHRAAAMAAMQNNKSLSEWLNDLIESNVTVTTE